MLVKRYRSPHNLALLPMGALLMIFAMLEVIAPLPLVAHLVGAAGLVGGFLAVRFALVTGVEVSDDAVCVRRPPFSKRFARSEVLDVVATPWFDHSQICFVLRDGRRITTSVLQGWRANYPGGHTRDVLSVLRAEFGLPTEGGRVA